MPGNEKFMTLASEPRVPWLARCDEGWHVCWGNRAVGTITTAVLQELIATPGQLLVPERGLPDTIVQALNSGDGVYRP